MIVLFLASCGKRNASSDTVEPLEIVDTLSFVSDIPEEFQEETVSEPVIRIDTLSAEEFRETIMIAMSQDSAPQYDGGKYRHLRHMPDSLRNSIFAKEDPGYRLFFREYISDSDWECQINILPESDRLVYFDWGAKTYYYVAGTTLIDVTNKKTQTHFRQEITRDFAVADSLSALKDNFTPIESIIESISPDTVKIYVGYMHTLGSFLSEVHISVSKDGNVTFMKRTQGPNDEWSVE